MVTEAQAKIHAVWDLPQGLGCIERGLEYGNVRKFGAGVWVDSSPFGNRKAKQENRSKIRSYGMKGNKAWRGGGLLGTPSTTAYPGCSS